MIPDLHITVQVGMGDNLYFVGEVVEDKEGICQHQQ